MNVLVACECSGIVRDVFRAKGHDAWSCDLQECEGDSRYHLMCDARDAIKMMDWDLMIAHPPCTYLSSSGARWMYEEGYEGRDLQQLDGAQFFLDMVTAPIPRIAVENPVGVMSTMYRKPDQIIQPWMFGHGVLKATCLWLKGLPKLTPTCVIRRENREDKIHKMDGVNQSRDRSRTFKGIAEAMAGQWG